MVNASPRLERFINRLNLFLSFVGLTSLLLGGIAVGNAVHSFLEKRLPTIATVKCLGASQNIIFNTYLIQILGLSLFSILIGLILGAGIPMLAAPLLTEKLNITNQMGVYPHVWGLSALFGILTTLCFSLWPLGKSCQTPAADLFRKGTSFQTRRPKWPYIVAILCAVEGLATLAIFTSTNQKLSLWFVAGAIITVIIFLSGSFVIKSISKKLTHIHSINLRFGLTNLYRPGNVTNGILLSLGLGMTVLVMIVLIDIIFPMP